MTQSNREAPAAPVAPAWLVPNGHEPIPSTGVTGDIEAAMRAIGIPAPAAPVEQDEPSDEDIDALIFRKWGTMPGAMTEAHREFARAVLALRPKEQ